MHLSTFDAVACPISSHDVTPLSNPFQKPNVACGCALQDTV